MTVTDSKRPCNVPSLRTASTSVDAEHDPLAQDTEPSVVDPNVPHTHTIKSPTAPLKAGVVHAAPVDRHV